MSDFETVREALLTRHLCVDNSTCRCDEDQANEALDRIEAVVDAAKIVADNGEYPGNRAFTALEEAVEALSQSQPPEAPA